MWGQGFFLPVLHGSPRIIPTRVGTRWRCPVLRKVCRDHPHACGDKAFENIVGSFKKGSSPRVWGQEILPKYYYTGGQGSSPRVWGQVYYVFFFQFCTGIIPTRVGTSQFNGKLGTPVGDHPHACGDKGGRTGHSNK